MNEWSIVDRVNYLQLSPHEQLEPQEQFGFPQGILDIRLVTEAEKDVLLEYVLAMLNPVTDWDAIYNAETLIER